MGVKRFQSGGFWDTRLSDAGIRECSILNLKLKQLTGSKANFISNQAYREALHAFSEKNLSIYSSPLTRTIQTAEILFKDIQISSRIAHPLLRERLYLSSDKGRKKNVLEKEFTKWDFSLLPDDLEWWYETRKGEDYVEWRPEGEYLCNGEPEDVFRSRMKDLRKWIISQPDDLVLVTHWGVISSLTGKSFENCEAASFYKDQLLLEPYIAH